MLLAPGVDFDVDKHEYTFKGKKLSGVTGKIQGFLGNKFPEDYVGEHREEGLHIHKAIERWIETGESGSVHPGVVWLTEELRKKHPRLSLHSEVLVSDFKQYASSVDIVVEEENGKFTIYDIKKGKMNREAVTWQLSIYKYFIEKYAEKKVGDCICISLKDKEFYDIFPKKAEEVEKLLYK